MSTIYNTKKITLAFSFFSSLAMGFQAHAMGSKLPAQDPVEKTPKIIRTPSALPSTNSTTSFQVDIWKDTIEQSVDTVEAYYKTNQLPKQRSTAGSHEVDFCDTNLDNKRTFGERIGYMVDVNFRPLKSPLGYVSSYFQIPKNNDQYYPTSLLSHKMCPVTADTLSKTLDGRRLPNSADIKKVQTWIARYNYYRDQALNGNRDGYVKLQKLWNKTMMCLANVESLTSADSSSSQSTASKFAPSDYRRPAGVAFYDDPFQTDPASKLNIGIFQFGTVSGGDPQGCIQQWNQLYPTCQISKSTGWQEMVRIVGSSYQTFNAFCGVNYMLQNFSVQVNTTNPYRTHPANLVNGKLKDPADRCVSLHFSSKVSYNHFGPLQNVMGDTIGLLMNCSLQGE
ncbi:MAG: hypothetical protein ACXVCY_10120 [Pseudobdellovibrionaceae bacterium]